MAIAKMYSDPMLGTFRKMAQECTDNGHSGESYDNMMKTLARMEELAQKHSDFSRFSAQMTEEQLQLKFSQYYSEVLRFTMELFYEDTTTSRRVFDIHMEQTT